MEFLELFTSPTCPYCPQARRIVEDLVETGENLLLIERDITNPENEESALRYGITGVPTLVINERYKIQGIPNPVELQKIIQSANIYRG